MATLDDGIENLRRFIAKLVAANAAVDQVTAHLQESTRELTQLEGTATEQGGGLNDDLEQAGTQLEGDHAEAVKALEELARESGSAEQAVEGERTQVEQAARGFEDTARSVATDLDEESGRLTQDGFGVLAQTIDEVEAELESARSESGQAWTELQGAIDGFEARSQTAWDAGDAALDESAAAAAGLQAALEAEAAAGVQGLDQAGDELEGDCATLVQELAAVYDACAAGIDAEASALAAEVQDLGDQVLAFVQTEGDGRLAVPAAAVENEALEGLETEYTNVAVAVTAGLATSGVLDPLTEDLAKSKTVVGQVDRLISAMA
jgi:chromosome segregation ATPase